MNEAFQRFMEELAERSPALDYVWTQDKSRSAKWMADRIPGGARGVDVGGTEWLCQELRAKGCDVTYFDIRPPASFPKFVVDDMFNIMQHFAERSLDFIVTRHTLEHSVCPLFQLWCFNKLLRDGGKLLVIVPIHLREWIWFGTHYNCLPYENWLMLFHRAGFKVITADAGSWKPFDAKFIEYRFELAIQHRDLQLLYSPAWM